ncbi:MAG: C_GCAxxG_C_C family protein [Oscillospiraceae bacterium]|nr:C_GCAxxG_C_C family protein [Oscillospiraceae bacterium]MBR3554708.1 C_GCAxxG_C_C family protein [Oscillospiraceae bacterium]
MNKQEIIDLCAKAAKEAQIRDDVCSRSVLVGLKAYFDIPEDLIRASSNLCGGAGAASGSCGTYTCGQLALGLKYNHTPEEELENPELFDVTSGKFMEFRDRFMKEFGTTLCPEIHKQVFGRAYIYYKPEDAAEYFKITDHHIRCAETVERATRLIAAMLLEDEEETA